MEEIETKEISMMGMPLVEWKYRSCTANFGVSEEEKYATLYEIISLEQGKGHATYLLTAAKKFFEDTGYKFGGSVALNDRMKSIYKRLNIEEYN